MTLTEKHAIHNSKLAQEIDAIVSDIALNALEASTTNSVYVRGWWIENTIRISDHSKKKATFWGEKYVDEQDVAESIRDAAAAIAAEYGEAVLHETADLPQRERVETVINKLNTLADKIDARKAAAKKAAKKAAKTNAVKKAAAIETAKKWLAANKSMFSAKNGKLKKNLHIKFYRELQQENIKVSKADAESIYYDALYKN